MADLWMAGNERLMEAFGGETGGIGEIIRPRHMSPQWSKGPLWITLQARQLDYQTTLARGKRTGQGVSETIAASFKFLAPVEFPEVLEHQWEQYESLASRALQFGVTVGKAYEAAQGVRKAYKGLENQVKNIMTGEGERIDITQSLGQLVSDAGGAPVFQHRIDTPLVYKGTDRRKLTFVFNFIDEGDPKQDVIYPIRLLQRLSCPEPAGDLLAIKLPYVFKIDSEPSHGFLRVENAALTTVSPTYYGPYIDGYPMRASIELTFVDLAPLYRETFDKMEPRVEAVESGIPKEKQLDRLQALAMEANKNINKVRAGIREANRIKGIAVGKVAIGIPNTAKSYIDEVTRGML